VGTTGRSGGLFQVAEQIYDATVVFCDRFIDRRSRTHDQMVQAARSGRQNIAEGSMAAATSKKSELKLTNVAKASLEELLLDYEDFLRQSRLPLWPGDSPRARKARAWVAEHGAGSLERLPPEEYANAMLCLVNHPIYLLKRQLERLEHDFLAEGGFTERLYRQRSKHQRKQRF
jgi:four helix bundle suffix protein